ncbi:DUF4190 domain-containing protein [Streptomyces sp. NPDC002889]|uniref:DUF4190 domain-containing protein n=1 Tax=Streptomyces sp. NPDC002889 TaxID=3364669 RepID=UPI00368AD25A
MSDNQAQPAGGPQPRDPWAPPESSAAQSAPQDGVPLGKQPAAAPRPVHDQPTVTSMPAVGSVDDMGAVPPPPTAPGGPAQSAAGAYGYPAAPAGGAFGPAASDPYGAGYPGYPGYPGYGQPGWQQSPANGMGITAMVLGILAVCLFCVYGVLSVILGVLALIFGILGRKRVGRGEATNGGMALAGIILGSIGIVIGAVVIGLLAWGITRAINEDRNNDYDYDDSYSNTLVVDVSR